MTTVKGFVRSYSATVRRIEKDHRRRERENALTYQRQLKQESITNVANAVANYTNYVDALTSVHKAAPEPIDWQQILEDPAPQEPVKDNSNENEAIRIFERYIPSFFDKLFGSTKGKREKLNKNILVAKEKDNSEFIKRREQYHAEKLTWEKLQNISREILDKKVTGYKDAIEYFQPLSEISEIGSKINFTIERDYIITDLHVNGSEIIPNYILTQTSTGKASKKDMPVSKFNALYQDYACSCILRVARELLALIPVKFIIVNAVAELLNTSTGRMEQQPVISAAIFPDTLNRLNLDQIDPSDSMKNFIHNMKFSKTSGFVAVEKIDPGTIALS